jgi:inner membrane protein
MPSRLSHWVERTQHVPFLSDSGYYPADIDVLANRFGFDHTTMFGHRGLTHSLFFAMALSGIVVWLFFRKPVDGMMSRLALFAFFFAATASHSVLDAMVDGTLGVAFLAPLSSARFFLPWRPIVSSPIGLAFFSSSGATTILNEFTWVWIPSFVVILAPWLRNRFLTKRSSPDQELERA